MTGWTRFATSFTGVPLENDIVDAMLVQELTEQQAGRSGAYDRDLRTHYIECPPVSR